MAHKTFTNKDILRAQITQYGITDTARHYVKLAAQASDRFAINLIAEKHTVAITEATEMRRQIAILSELLSDDSKSLEDTLNNTGK